MIQHELKTLFLLVFSFSLLAFLPGFSGCNTSLISGVKFKIEPNLETLKVQLNFSSAVQTDLGALLMFQMAEKIMGPLK